MSLSSDRFQYEGETRVDQATRDEADQALAQLAALRERFLLEAAAFAAGVKAISPHLINRWEFATRDNTASFEEVAASFVQYVTDNVADLINKDEVERLTDISETGADHD